MSSRRRPQAGRIALALFALAVAGRPAWAQETPASQEIATVVPAPAVAGEGLPAEGYYGRIVAPGALPPAIGIKKRDAGQVVARAGILAAGAFPFAMLYTNLGFDLVTFIAKGGDTRYAPWPFRNQYSILPDTGERIFRLAVAVGASLVLGVADSILTGLGR